MRVQEQDSDIVTLQEQEEKYGRKRGGNLVLARPEKPALPPAPINAQVSHVIDATPHSTQHIEMRTSAVDRAIGFAIATAPLCVGFAVTVVGICVLGFGVPLFSLPALVITFIVFATVWALALTHTLNMSAEGVSMFEAGRKWDVIDREHMMRWAHYNRSIEGRD